MDISLFKKHIDKHPFNTFGKSEIEGFMAWVLKQCIEANDLDHVVYTTMNEDYLCDMDILEKVGTQQYRMTESSKQTLYEVYKREFLEPEDFKL